MKLEGEVIIIDLAKDFLGVLCLDETDDLRTLVINLESSPALKKRIEDLNLQGKPSIIKGQPIKKGELVELSYCYNTASFKHDVTLETQIEITDITLHKDPGMLEKEIDRRRHQL